MLLKIMLVLTILAKTSANNNHTEDGAKITKNVTSIKTSDTVTKVLTVITSKKTADNSFDTAEQENVTQTKVVSQENTICSWCDCNEGIIDCTDRQIRRPFEIMDWKGLEKSNPVEIDFSGNPLMEISEISELPLRKLNYSHCIIEFIDDACFVRLKELSSIDFSHNKLSTFSLNRKVFAGILVPRQRPQQFLKMRFLSLAYNNINSLPQDLFAFMTALTHLDLSGNPLTIIDQVTMGAISDLIYLKELKLSKCDLETIPEGMFRRLPKLERLDLSGNRFATVPNVLKEAVNLIYFNFDNNLLETLNKETAITTLKKLEELHLCYNNKLKSISSGALGGLGSLKVLYISNNFKLSKIDSNFLINEDDFDNKPPLIKELYLHCNNLTEISSEILDEWEELTMVDFTNNPYFCDCNNQWMVDNLMPLVIRLSGKLKANKMVCRKPDSLSGKTLVELYKENTKLVCEYAADLFNAAVPNLFLLFGIIIGVFATFPLVLIVVLLWRRGYLTRYHEHIDDDKWKDEETDNF